MSNAKADESSLWEWLSKAEEPLAFDLHMNRVENSAMKGTPDVEACYLTMGFHIELKALERPAKPSTPIDTEISEQQAWWAVRRRLAGGRSFFLIQIGSGHDAKRYLIPATYVESLTENSVTESDLNYMSFASRPVESAVDVVFICTGQYDKVI